MLVEQKLYDYYLERVFELHYTRSRGCAHHFVATLSAYYSGL